MRDLPTGVVTFLFTDVEGSTRLWEQAPGAMRGVLARHDELIESLTEANEGLIVRPRGEGDSRFAVFSQASSALLAAAAIQTAMFTEPWSTPAPLRVRIAINTGEADLRMGDYYGSVVNRCARLRSIAHGGQTLLTAAVKQVIDDQPVEGIGIRDLGDHRLKDLDHAEHVFELTVDGLPNEFPPLKSLGTLPNNLPFQLTSFVGRDQDSGAVRDLLSKTRLLTVTGSGGSGKTRLALQVAADVVDFYKDGVWLVELAPVTDPALVPASLAAVLGARESQNVSLIDVLCDYLYDKQMLIVLDNCEHLILACAQLANTLLRACPQVKILATSRESLNVFGETAWRIPSLALPDSNSEEPIESLARCEAIQLFIERAKAVRPDFVLTAQNAPAATQICRRLDGIPLAIELATTRIRGMSVEQVASRLDDQFRLLTGGSRTALSRHQTLRTLIDWSYSLLTEPECLLLRRLSVFVGGWTLDVCETVCAGEGIEQGDVMDLLLQLVNKSLVVPEERGAETRYRLLETIRQYAREKLMDSGEGGTLRDRHMRAYVAIVADYASRSRIQGGLYGLHNADSAEQDNLQAAFEWSLTRDLDVCFRVAAGLALGTSSETGGSILLRLLPEALERDKTAAVRATPAARADALFGLGELCITLGQNVTALKYLEESIEIFRQIDAKQSLADALGMSFSAYALSGESAIVQATIQEAVQLYQQIGDSYGLSMAFQVQAWGAFYVGDYDTARAKAEVCMQLSKESEDRWGTVTVLVLLGQIADTQGDYGTGRTRYEAALTLSREMSNPRVTGMIISGLGNNARRQDDLEEATALYSEVLDIWKKVGNRGAVALVQQIFGYILVAQGDYPAARVRFEESLALRQREDNPRELAGPLEGLASLAAATGNDHRAACLLGAATTIRGEAGQTMDSYDQAEVEKTVEWLRTRLDEDEFQASWAEGAAMTIDQAVSYAYSSADAG